MVVSDAEKSNSSQVRKSRASLPTIGIYRPPAARRSTEECSKLLVSPASEAAIVEPSTKNAVKPSKQKVRRPDQQVYVPRAKRAFNDSDRFEDAPASSADNHSSPRLPISQTSDLQAEETFRSSSNLIIEDKKPSKQRSFSPTGKFHSLPPRASHLVETKKKLCQSTSSDLDLEGIGSHIPIESERSPSTMNSTQPVTLPPRAEVLVEKKKKLLCQSISLSEDYKWKAGQDGDPELKQISADSAEHTSVLIEKDSSKSRKPSLISDSEIASVIDLKVTDSNTVSESKKKCDIVLSEDSPQDKKNSDTVLKIKDSDSARSAVDEKCKHVETKQTNQSAQLSDDEYQDAHNEAKTNGLTNMCDRSSGSSESLSSSDSVNASVTPVQLMKPVKTDLKKKLSTDKPARVFNPDECDWDALLDEDVLDPFLMKELTSAVGEVQVTQPKSDYRNYRSQVPVDHHKTRRSAGDEDFSHVVEIYSFPPEFKTHDLAAVLSPFKNTAGGFEIKWVDDTHALGVFTSALVAEQVLAYQHPMVRMRPLCDATLESRLKARRLTESIQSFRPRPETCAALARRLVTGALGVKLPTARQEREEEKRVLREAREKRRLAVQQQDDIWNS